MRTLAIAAGVLAFVSIAACSRGGSSNTERGDAAKANDGAAAAGERASAPLAPVDAMRAETAATPAAYPAPGSAPMASVDTTPADNPAAAQGSIVVNGVTLDAVTQTALIQAYGAIPDGSYWYDPMSGLVGLAGGPSSARILPNLPLGGPLQANASGGGDGRMTGVFINGREIHMQEFMTLTAMFGAVNPGRYWLGADFVGGYEGGPPMFDLKASARASANGGPGYNKSTLFGDLMSDGQCSGYFDPSSGSSVMTGNC